MIILDYILSVAVYIANAMILFVLVKMKSSKKCVIILFGNMTISHFVAITAHTVRTACWSAGVTSHSGCVALIVIIETSTLTYISTVALLYLELYLSTKLMRVKKSVISTKVTIILITAAWVFSFLIAVSGVSLLNPLTAHQPLSYEFCNLGVYVFHPIHTSLFLGAMTVNTVALVVFHVLCYRVIKKSYDQQRAQTVKQGSDGLIQISANLRWTQTKKDQLNLLLVILGIVSVCWGSFILLHFLAAFCPPCRPYFNIAVIVIARLLFATPMVSNGIVYLTKSPAFKTTFKTAVKSIRCRRIKRSEVHPA